MFVSCTNTYKLTAELQQALQGSCFLRISGFMETVYTSGRISKK